MENKITITYNGKEYIFYIKIHHRYWGIMIYVMCVLKYVYLVMEYILYGYH